MLEFLATPHWKVVGIYVLKQYYYRCDQAHWYNMSLGPGGFLRLCTDGSIYLQDLDQKGYWVPPARPIAVDQEETTVLLNNGDQYQLSFAYDAQTKSHYLIGTPRQYPLERERFWYRHSDGPGVADYRQRFVQLHEYPNGKYLALKPNGRVVFVLAGARPPRWYRDLRLSTREDRYRHPLLQKFPLRERITYIYHYQGCYLLVGRSGMLYRLGRKHPALVSFPHACAK